MLVAAVVVQDDVQREVARERAVETPQELEEFLVRMTPVAFADDRAGQHVQRREQRRRAVARVVVVRVPRRPGFIGRPGWVRSRA